LGGVDGGGVVETGRGVDVVGWEPDGAVPAGVPPGQVTAPADVGDDPPVTVFDPVGCADTKPAVIPPGDDQIADAGPVAVG
jgi:hypothetical protein